MIDAAAVPRGSRRVLWALVLVTSAGCSDCASRREPPPAAQLSPRPIGEDLDDGRTEPTHEEIPLPEDFYALEVDEVTPDNYAQKLDEIGARLGVERSPASEEGPASE